MSWTDERIDRLKQLWAEGLSASKIADQLGGVTRNAVIGKVHRLKLDSRGKPNSVESAPAPTQMGSVNGDPGPIPAHAQAVSAAAHANVNTAAQAVSTGATASAAPEQTNNRPSPTASIVGATALKMEPEMQEDAALASEIEETREPAQVVPISRKLALVELTEQTCKWPVGDPLDADFHFCGNNAGHSSPYCKYHASVAFQQATEKKRVR